MVRLCVSRRCPCFYHGLKQQCLYLYCCAPRLEGWWGTFSSSSIFVVSALFQRVGSGGASGARSEIGDLLTVRCSRLVRSTRFR